MKWLNIGILREIFTGNVGIMALSWFLFGLSGALVMPFFSLYAQALGAPDVMIAVIRSAGMYVLAGSIILGGVMTDYIGRVKTIILGTSLIVVTQYAYAFVADWIQLSIVWIIDEAAHFYQPALSAIIMDSLPRDKALRGFLALQSIPSIPWLFMPIIGGYLYDTYGLMGIRIGFIVSGTISLIVLFLRVKGLRETITVGKRGGIINSLIEIKNYGSELKKALKIILYSGFLSQLTIAVGMTYGSIYVVKVLGAPGTEYGLLNSISTATTIPLSLIFATHRSISGVKLALIGGLSLSFSQILVAVPGYMGVYDPLIVRSAFILGAIGNTVIWPIVSYMLSRVLPAEIRGRVTGLQRMFENIGIASATILAGYLYTVLGPANSFLLSGLLGFFSTIYLVILYLEIERSS